jgi:hypothetical protein
MGLTADKNIRKCGHLTVECGHLTVEGYLGV